MDYVYTLPGMEDLWFKIDEENEWFQEDVRSLQKRNRTPGLEDNDFDNDINPLETTGAYLSPKEFKGALLDENTVVLDTRNDYDLGHFRGAIRPDIRNFRELPQWVRDNKRNSWTNVSLFTAQVAFAVKISGWMVREGYKDVGQLRGIATYGKDPEVQGELWDGKMYVFDERIAVDINHVDPVVIGKDWFDGTPCERYVNCGNPECNRRILASEEKKTNTYVVAAMNAVFTHATAM